MSKASAQCISSQKQICEHPRTRVTVSLVIANDREPDLRACRACCLSLRQYRISQFNDSTAKSMNTNGSARNYPLTMPSGWLWAPHHIVSKSALKPRGMRCHGVAAAPRRAKTVALNRGSLSGAVHALNSKHFSERASRKEHFTLPPGVSVYANR